MSKAQILRFWLFAIAALVTFVLVPDSHWALWPLAFFPGQSGCFCCVEMACVWCNSGTTKSQYIVTIAGVIDSTCADCEFFNGSFVVDSDGPTSCAWTYVIDPEVCTFASVNMRVTAGAIPGFREVEVGVDGSLNFEEALAHVSGTIDCNFSSQSVGNPLGDPGGQCDFTTGPATCSVTAV